MIKGHIGYTVYSRSIIDAEELQIKRSSTDFPLLFVFFYIHPSVPRESGSVQGVFQVAQVHRPRICPTWAASDEQL